MKPWKGFLAQLALLLCAVTSSNLAWADVPTHIKWNCFLPSSDQRCDDLLRGLLKKVEAAKVVDSEKDADIVITTSGTTDRDYNLYVMEFLGVGDLPKFTIHSKYPNTNNPDAVKLGLLEDYARGIKPYSEILMIKSGVVDPGPVPGSSLTNDRRWYLAPGVMTSLSNASISQRQFTGWVHANFSAPAWRIQGDVYGDYQKMSISVPGSPEMVGEAFSYGARTVVSYSFHENWSIAAIAEAGHHPGENLRSRLEQSAGLEWTLVPFLKTKERNIAVRYVIGSEEQRYITPNTTGDLKDAFLKHSASIYFAWQLDKLDLGLRASFKAPVTRPEYGQASLSASVSYRVNEAVTIGTHFWLNFQDKFLSQPAEIDNSNPLQTFVGGANYAQISWGASVTVNFYFGNSLLDTEDQRWKQDD